MSPVITVQPDQNPQAWDDHVHVYEQAFEPLTNAFAAAALGHLGPVAGKHLIDIGAGAGGAALAAARMGAEVTAIDASAGMVSRIAARAAEAGLKNIDARRMDAGALSCADVHFDLALSVFGIILMSDAERGIAEMRRVLKKGGRAAIVTWTQPHRYELAARLRNAILAVRGSELPGGPLPAQLRFVDPALFRALVESAAFTVETVTPVEAFLQVPSAEWLAENLAFAPGLAAMMAALGPERAGVSAHFAQTLKAEQGNGPIRLGAVAHIAVAVAR